MGKSPLEKVTVMGNQMFLLKTKHVTHFFHSSLHLLHSAHFSAMTHHKILCHYIHYTIQYQTTFQLMSNMHLNSQISSKIEQDYEKWYLPK